MIDSDALFGWTKKIVIINGVIDLFVGLPMLLFPCLLADLMGFSECTEIFRFLAGGWGIAAFCFGLTRIWVGFSETFVWPTVILGCTEGVLLGSFCVIFTVFTALTWLNTLIPMAIGLSFMLLYGFLLVLRRHGRQIHQDKKRE